MSDYLMGCEIMWSRDGKGFDSYTRYGDEGLARLARVSSIAEALNEADEYLLREDLWCEGRPWRFNRLTDRFEVTATRTEDTE